MLTDEMLQKAATKAALKLNDNLPKPSECKHEFSKEFERKMQKIVRRTGHPYLYRVLQTAACFVLIATLSFGSVLVVSAEARAAVWGWIKETYEQFVVYFVEDESASSQSEVEYQLEWLPEGYSFQQEIEDPFGKLILYSNSESQRLTFSYLDQSIDTVFLAEGVEYIQHHPVVNGAVADVYLATDENESNAIVWVDSKTETLLYITGYVPEEDLIRMAESVTQVNG